MKPKRRGWMRRERGERRGEREEKGRREKGKEERKARIGGNVSFFLKKKR